MAVKKKTETEKLTGADVVHIVVCLRHNHKFDDIPNGSGGTKSVVLYGTDAVLQGKRKGILTESGNGVHQTLSRTDWEAIKALHGRETMFIGAKGFLPSVFEIKNENEMKSDTVQDKIAQTSGGFDPASPKDAKVEEAKE